MTVLEQWLGSGIPALITGRPMALEESGHLPGKPTELKYGQASAYLLTSSDGARWILKKFLPGKQPEAAYVGAITGCVPQAPECSCGWQRQILTSTDLGPSRRGTFGTPELAAWLDGTILMPRLAGRSWGSTLQDLADGDLDLAPTVRLAIASRLAETIMVLELAQVSHRDLSSGNILLNLRRGELHLIDWDSLFHPTLRFQLNTTPGTEGYMAPWLASDAERSWCPHADRFALAVCIAEVLAVEPGMALHGNGSLFEQAALGRDSGAFDAATEALVRVLPGTADLFTRAWRAESFDDCPSPADWLIALPETTGSNAVLRRRAEAATRLRATVQAGLPDRALPIASGDAELAHLLSETERRTLADWQARLASLDELREALRTGDDEQIAWLANIPGVPLDQLRAGERLTVERSIARVQALAVLRQALAGGDEDLVTAWWRAIRLGCQIPPDQAALARAARGRRHMALATAIPAPPSSPRWGELEAGVAPAAIPSATAATPGDGAQQRRDNAVAALKAAITRGVDEEIVTAARVVHETGARAEDIAWDAVYNASARAADLATLRAALQSGEVERAACAWAKAKTLWPTAINSRLDDAGRAAFRQWGGRLRAHNAGVVRASDDA